MREISPLLPEGAAAELTEISDLLGWRLIHADSAADRVTEIYCAVLRAVATGAVLGAQAPDFPSGQFSKLLDELEDLALDKPPAFTA